METLEHLNFVKTNHNIHLTQIKERERFDKMIKEIKVRFVFDDEITRDDDLSNLFDHIKCTTKHF